MSSIVNIPADWEAVTPAWMTAALASAIPDVEVSDVELLLRDDGTNRRARFGLSYARGAGPETVFVKACDPAHAKLNAMTGGVLNEPRLFAAGIDLPVDHPRVYLAVVDEDRLDFILVMEDVVSRGGDPRDATRPLSVEQAASGVRSLARLHRAFWGDRFDDHPALGWVEPFTAWRGMAIGIDMGLKRVGDAIPPAVQKLSGAEIEGDYWTRFVRTLADGPQTLLHGDAHIGNTYVLPGDGVGLLDWQVLRRGNFAVDLGYFLQGAVTVEDRRSHEADLLDEYLMALELPEEERPTSEDVWRRYRASAAHGLALWLATAASDTWQRPEVSYQLAERYAVAFTDLDAAEAIDSLTGK